ncbi:hypothetical protein D9757_006479 [Collybiopsis confluens]|uniref:Uncharacterized protein n=1 Tax=Collybiopsis confluens TaxID=2823264 RepID=A0A8H5M8D4_9AGAR|nr:hypothetical protein D9757_006479 [Collybiopsis confluens]
MYPVPSYIYQPPAALLLLLCLYRVAWGLLRWYILMRNSGIPEIEKLDDHPSDRRLRGTAIICGGSIAGLFAARICHDFFERVIIVEPEEWLSGNTMRQFSWEQEHKRTRVMQYESLHAFQALLFDGLKKLFPGFEEECRSSGISVSQADRQSSFSGIPIPLPTRSYGGNLAQTLWSSRAGFETLLRRAVLGRGRYPQIEQLAGTVVGVSPQSNDVTRIGKVTVRGADLQVREFEASLIVGMKWLAQAGYGSEPVSSGKIPLQQSKIALDQKLHYSTLICTVTPSTLKKLPIPNDLDPNTLFYAVMEDKTDFGRRLFVLTRIDGNRLAVFAGQSSDQPVKYKTLDDIRSFIRELGAYAVIPEWIFQTIDLLEDAQPAIDYSHVRVPGSSYIQYHKVGNLPINFTAIGDSVLSVDPLYGQGCTKAMLGAVALHTVLAQSATQKDSGELPPDFSNRFFKEHFNKTDSFWQTTRLLDYGVPCTTPVPGEDLSSGRLLRWYFRRLQILAITDEQAGRVIWDGGMGYGTPIDSLHPWLVMKVIWGVITGGIF